MTRPLLLTFLLAAPLAAVTPVGNWTLASAPDIPAAIDAATAPMNFLFRPFARSRLRKTNLLYPRILVDRQGTEFIIQYGERQPIHIPADGSPVIWAREDGEKLTLTAHLAGDDLEQTFKAGDGERINLFHVDPASHTLKFQVTVRSPRLPGPLSYTIDYRQQ